MKHKYNTFDEYYESLSPKGRIQRKERLKGEIEKLKLERKISKLKDKDSKYVFGKRPLNHKAKHKVEDYITPNYKKKEIKRREVIRKKSSKDFDNFLNHI